MRAAAWFRALLAVVTCGVALWAFIQGTCEIGRGCMNVIMGDILIWLVGVPLLIVGLPSIFLAVALFMNSRRGVMAALIFDVLVAGLIIIGILISNAQFSLHGDSEVTERLVVTAVAAAVALLFSAEAAGLLRACRGWTSAWRDYAALALTLGLMALAWPLLANYRHVQHVRGLTAYIATHLIDVPADTPITISRDVAPGGGHTDYVRFNGPGYCWGFSARHADATGWSLQGEAGWAFAVGKAPKIQSSAEARAYLGTLGLPENKLGDHRISGKDYDIDAPAAGGIFRVTSYGNVKLVLSKPLLVPER